MAIWEKATLVDGSDPGSSTGDPGDRVTVNPVGTAWVRILSPSHRLNDGADYTFIGFGHPQIIQG
jgi:hypothetical protein